MTDVKCRAQSTMTEWVTVFLLCMLMASGCTERKVGGMTEDEAFSDPRVVRLVEAASRGRFSEADKALESGADINTIGKTGISPLLWVMSASNIDLSCTEYMLKKGANPNYRVEGRGDSAMYFAAGGRYPRLLELILTYGGDPNLLGEREMSMLSVAANEGREENIKILLKRGANINYVDRLEYPAAYYAVPPGRYDLVAYFLEQGLSANLQQLAKGVEARVVAHDSDQQKWKLKVIEMLKQRGVTFPAFDPANP